MEKKWFKADRPNYITNENLRYPYSELPYFGQYTLVRIPVDNELIEHVDYWGEGRLDAILGISGFPNCYNVNRQYQLVSNGSDKFCKIPNRIPVIDEDNCDTSKYIKNQSVKLVTLMGAPIIESCAKDIARMVNPAVGSVVIFDFPNNSIGFRRLNTELKEISLFYCPGYELPEYLQGLTLFDTHEAFLNATETEEQLYKALIYGKIDTAVEITISLDKNGGDFIISKIVDKVLQEGIPGIMSFPYKLWISDAKDIVKKYFPEIFILIFNGDEVEIVNHYYKNTMLKLDSHDDEWKNRLAWGDKSGDTGTRFCWTMVPVWKEDKVIFQIKNYEHQMYLRLDINADSVGDRKCWGSARLDDVRFDWTLEPIKLYDAVAFYIVNCQYEQPLKLDAHEDRYGDRQLWGANGRYTENPEYFSWIVRSYYK